MEADQPEFVLHEIFIGNFWKDHGLGKPILGTKETVKQVRRRTCCSITIPRLLSEEHSDHGGRKSGARCDGATGSTNGSRICEERRHPAEAIRAPDTCAHRPEEEGISGAGAHYAGRSVLSAGARRAIPCYVLNTVLGGGMSSRLFQNIRERQGLAYAVYSELNLFSDTGCFSIYAGTAVESARKVVDSIMQEFRELKAELIVTRSCGAPRIT